MRPGRQRSIRRKLTFIMLVSAVFPMIISVAAWLPCILAMVELTIRQGQAFGGKPATIPWVVLGALGIGMAASGGCLVSFYKPAPAPKAGAATAAVRVAPVTPPGH